MKFIEKYTEIYSDFFGNIKAALTQSIKFENLHKSKNSVFKLTEVPLNVSLLLETHLKQNTEKVIFQGLKIKKIPNLQVVFLLEEEKLHGNS